MQNKQAGLNLSQCENVVTDTKEDLLTEIYIQFLKLSLR